MVTAAAAGVAGSALFSLPSAALVEAYSVSVVSALLQDACATHAGHIEAQPNATNSVPTLRTLLFISASHLQCKILFLGLP